MNVYGLIGYPLGHSFSRQYFTTKFQEEKIPGCQYRNYEFEDLAAGIAALKSDPQVRGLNVTIPYKEAILPYLNTLSPECREIGACNCIRVAGEEWMGFNTDVTGFTRSFSAALKPWHRKALVLGTGGSSRAIVYALRQLHLEFIRASRNHAAQPGIIAYPDITAALLQEYTVVINTTPSGMFPHAETCPPLPYEAITPRHYFFDLVYNPSRTLFLQKAESQGAVTRNGADMLVIQAEESWAIWNR